MSYSKMFGAEEKEEAVALAKDFMKKLDYTQQPSMNPPYEDGGYWFVKVTWWGFD